MNPAKVRNPRNGHEHWSQAAMERCLECAHPELFEITPEDEVKVRLMVEDGWLSVSARYRTIAKVVVVPFEDAVPLFEGPRWLLEELKEAYERLVRNAARSTRAECVTRQLTHAEFRAFKRLGGQSA